MYGHPENPDPWSDRQEIPDTIDREDATDPSGFTAACLVIALPVFAFSFALGYMGSVWGWF